LPAPTTTDPTPYVPIRRSGWPVRRTPMWILLALVLLAGASVLVSLSHRPSNAQQTTDLNGYLKDMNAAIESCAGGVRESQQALSAIEAGPKDNLSTAVRLVTYNANNCEPANSEPLADLTQYQVTESLARFDLQNCTNDFVTWAFDAVPVQTDMVTVMTARSAAARTAANAALQRDQRTLNADRATIYSILRAAEHTLADHAALPSLPS
jgi:predicted amidohydrolase YtcJ